jgi:hypothetical protein
MILDTNVTGSNCKETTSQQTILAALVGKRSKV